MRQVRKLRGKEGYFWVALHLSKGIYMAIFVTLVNRSSKTLTGTWDGKHYLMEPGRHSFPEYMAEKFKLQNPVMGSEDPRTLHTDYLMGIVEQNDDISPIEQSDAIEKWDRSKVKTPTPVEVVPGITGIYSRRDVASEPLPLDSAFTKA